MKINKLLTRSALGIPSDTEIDVFDSVESKSDSEILLSCKYAWEKLEPFRERRRRNYRYLFGKHWDDMVEDVNGSLIKEEELIKRRGRVPLVHNLIRQILKTVVGQYRSNKTQAIVSVRDTDEVKLGEMMSIALQYVNQVNQKEQLDADALLEMCTSGVCFQSAKYELLPMRGTPDGFVENLNTARMFWSSNLEDPRGWDLKMIGQIHDLRISDVVAAFSKGSRKKAIEIRKTYSESGAGIFHYSQHDKFEFLVPANPKICRVIEVWREETKEMFQCHDLLEGKLYWVNPEDIKKIDIQNAERILEYQKIGVGKEDALLINYKWGIHKFWYYRFLTPWGNILDEGETPYWHNSHPFTYRYYNLYDGMPHPFVEDMIDQNRMINRMLTQWDYIQSTSAKNPVFYDLQALKGTTPEQLKEDYQTPGAMIGFDVPATKKLSDMFVSEKGTPPNVGTFDMISLMSQFMDTISGVHGAMRGEKPASGTAASLFAQQTQQSAVNLVDLFESFQLFRVDGDTKMMKVIQQYYDKKKIIRVAGENYSKEASYYDPDRVRDAEFDLIISESTSTTSYRGIMDNFLLELFKEKAIDIKMMLSNVTFPFAEKLLQSIESEEQQQAQQQIGQGQSGGIGGVNGGNASQQPPQQGQLPQYSPQPSQQGQ
jgi:hypothetical protein